MVYKCMFQVDNKNSQIKPGNIFLNVILIDFEQVSIVLLCRVIDQLVGFKSFKCCSFSCLLYLRVRNGYFKGHMQTGIYLLKVKNRNTRTKCDICLKLTIKTSERRRKLYCWLWTYFTPCSSISIVNFRHAIAGWNAIGRFSKYNIQF